MAQAKATSSPDQSTPVEREHNPFTKSATGGRVLSALMLPFFMVRPPAGFGVLTTSGRRTGRTRRKCIRVVRRGEKAYAVMLGPALLGETEPKAVSAWLWNIRANPNVGLRIRGGAFAGLARELEDPVELERAREAYCESIYSVDYIECNFHLGGRPTADRIKAMLRHWFASGIPLVIELNG